MPLKVSQLVMLCWSMTWLGPEVSWKLARVEDLITGSDGQVRGACIRVGSADNQSTLLRRPVHLLYPLEAHRHVTANRGGETADRVTESDLNVSGGGQPDQGGPEEASCQDVEDSVSLRRRPTRIAAQNAREVIRLVTEDPEL